MLLFIMVIYHLTLSPAMHMCSISLHPANTFFFFFLVTLFFLIVAILLGVKWVCVLIND